MNRVDASAKCRMKIQELDKHRHLSANEQVRVLRAIAKEGIRPSRVIAAIEINALKGVLRKT